MAFFGALRANRSRSSLIYSKCAENKMSFEIHIYRLVEFWPEKSLSFLGRSVFSKMLKKACAKVPEINCSLTMVTCKLVVVIFRANQFNFLTRPVPWWWLSAWPPLVWFPSSRWPCPGSLSVPPEVTKAGMRRQSKGLPRMHQPCQ